MSWIRRLRGTFRGERLDRDVEEELQFHLEMRRRELIAQGISPNEARQRVNRRFGNHTWIRERTRETDLLGWLDSLARDVAFGIRAMRRNPLVTAAAVLSLALAMGANTIMFTLMDTVVFRALPVRDPASLVLLERPGGQDWALMWPDFSFPLFERLRNGGAPFADLFACSTVARNTVSIGGQAEALYRQSISGNAFTILGVRPALGRLLTAADDASTGNAPIAVISYGLWERRFGLDPAVLEKTLVMGDRPYQIVGVAEPRFFGVEVGTMAEVWTPVAMEPANRLSDNSWMWVRILGRLKPGASPAQAWAPMQMAFSRSLEEQAKDIPADVPRDQLRKFLAQRLAVEPGARGLSRLRKEYLEPLIVMLAVAGLVLLIACTNIANLLLARGAARQREMAVRVALGAGRGRLIRQLLTESLLLALFSGALGLVLAALGTPLLVKQLAPEQNPVRLALGVDWRVLSFTGAICAFTTLLFGLLPAWRAARLGIASSMKSGGAGGAGGRFGFTAGKLLVSSQVAVSLVLLAGAAMFLTTWRNLATLHAGFDRQNFLMVNTQLRGSGRDAAGSRVVWEEALRRTSGIPGVQAASLSVRMLFGTGFQLSGVRLPGQPRDARNFGVYEVPVSTGFFQAAGIRLLAGRDFEPGDLADSAPWVAIVNQAFARQYFAGADPVGREYMTWYEHKGLPQTPHIRIIGLVQDTRFNDLHKEPPPITFEPMFHWMDGAPVNSAILEVRTYAGAAPLAASVSRELAAVSPDFQVRSTVRVAKLVDDTLIQERLLARLSGFFGGVALLLASLGLYGVMSYSVARRRTEIGVRMALGAPEASVLRMILKETVALVAAGAIAGFAAALVLARYIQSLLFGMKGQEPWTIASAVAVLAIVAIAAGYLPARRAARLDPLLALRYE